MQISPLLDVMDVVKSKDESPGSVAAVLDAPLEALLAVEAVERPRIFRGTQASLQFGSFLVNAQRRAVSKADYLAFVPYTQEQDPAPGEERQEVPPAELNVIWVDWVYLVRWQGENHRFLVGQLVECNALASEPGLITGFCDGSHGRRLVLPSLLTTKGVPNNKKHSYAVWLSQVRCTCLLAADGPHTLMTPVMKSTSNG